MQFSEMFGKIRIGFVYGLFVAVFAFVTMNLFFPGQANKIANYFSEGLQIDRQTIVENLVIAEPVAMTSFEPTVFETFTRQRLNNFYETLVKPDGDLNIEPSLALSWGMKSDTDWEIILRPNVQFHDGSKLDSGDVLMSVLRAKNFKNSELKDLLSTFKNVKIVDGLTLEIETNKPDPLFLQRLATVYILPSEILEKVKDATLDLSVENAIGTGSYKANEITNDGVLSLKRFENYWGQKPNFGNVKIVTITNTEGRVQAMNDGSVDILDYVPHDFVSQLGDDFKVYAVPSLEVQFLVFNTTRGVFKSQDVRNAVAATFDREGFAKYLGKYVKPSYQFVSTGVFGFNPDLSVPDYDAMNQSGEDEKSIVIYLPKGLENLGEYINSQLSGIGLKVGIIYFEGSKYQEALQNGGFDIYFMGYRNELGDAGDFLSSVAHSAQTVGDKKYGQYNFAKYSNELVDKNIEASEIELDAEKRLSELQSAMKTIVSGDVLGIPMFQYETVFAARKGLQFTPRIDGYIYINEIGI